MREACLSILAKTIFFKIKKYCIPFMIMGKDGFDAWQVDQFGVYE